MAYIPCSICQGPLERPYGNNAQPINDGRCCDRCDADVVIPARIERIKQGRDPYEVEAEYRCPVCLRLMWRRHPERKIRANELLQCLECGATVFVDPDALNGWRGLTPEEWRALKAERPELYAYIQENVKKASDI